MYSMITSARTHTHFEDALCRRFARECPLLRAAPVSLVQPARVLAYASVLDTNALDKAKTHLDQLQMVDKNTRNRMGVDCVL